MLSAILLLLSVLGSFGTLPVGAWPQSGTKGTEKRIINDGVVCDNSRGTPNSADCKIALDMLLTYQSSPEENPGIFKLGARDCTKPMTVNSCSLIYCNNDEEEKVISGYIQAWGLERSLYLECILSGQYGTISLSYNPVYNATFLPAVSNEKLHARDGRPAEIYEPKEAVGNRTTYFKPLMLDHPIVRLVGNATANCANNMEPGFNGTDCREAINVLFGKNLWTNPFDFPARTCVEGSTKNKTCTAKLCSDYSESDGARYDTGDLVRTMLKMHSNCSNKGASWQYDHIQMSLF